MLRLKPSRITLYRDFVLPPVQDLYTLTGKTSLIYRDRIIPNHLAIFSIERIKLLWWEHIGLTYSFTDAGSAYFSGFYKGNKYDYREYNFTVWMTVVPILRKPLGVHVQRLEAINQVLNAAHAHYKADNYQSNPWSYISHHAGLGYPEISNPTDYIRPISQDYYPDMGEGDWMVWNDQLTCIDPYHAKTINPIFWMERTSR